MDAEQRSYNSSPLTFQHGYATIPERLEALARKFGDKEIYVMREFDGGRHSITAQELLVKSKALARSLKHYGVEKGDVVATCLPNDMDCLVSMLGIICAGGVVINLLMVQQDGSDLKQHLENMAVKCLILNPSDDGHTIKTCMDFLQCSMEHGRVDSKVLHALKLVVSTSQLQAYDALLLQDLINEHSDGKTDNVIELPRLDPEDLVIYFVTSGSTGASKYVPHSHHSAAIIGHHLRESIAYEDGDIIYTERRMAWIGGFPFMYLRDGVKCVTRTAGKHMATLSEHCEFTYQVIVSEKCNVACLLPPTLVGLNDILAEKATTQIEGVTETVGNRETHQKTSGSVTPLLRNIHTGGMPVATVCMDTLGSLSSMVTNCYGSSEAGFMASNFIRNKSDFVNYSAGKPHSGVEIKVVDKDGFVVPRGAIGSIRVRSPCLFWQYAGPEGAEKTSSAVSLHHWMDTDDVGFMRDNGDIVISGRASDLILQGGKYHAPSAIEAFIKTHKDVLDVIVLAVPDDSLFELVCACVQPKPGHIVTPQEIKDFYVERMIPVEYEAVGRFRPKIVEIFEAYPRLYTGKPDKRALKELLLKRLNKSTN